MQISMINSLSNVAISLTSVMSVIILLKLYKAQKINRFMQSICLGVFSYNIGEFLFIVFDSAFPSFADVFYTIGSLIFITAFSYSYLESRRKLTNKEMVVVISVFVFTLISTTFLFYLTNNTENLLLENILNFFYPTSSVIIFLLVYLHQVNTKTKGGYLYYIMSSFFFFFIADMHFTYASWKGIYGVIGILYDILYLIGYIFLLFGIVLYHIKLKKFVERGGINRDINQKNDSKDKKRGLKGFKKE